MQNISYKMQNKNILKNQYYFQEKSSKGLPNTTFLKKSSAGFTLVEILVAVSVFVIVMTLATGLFAHVLRNHRKTLAYQEVFSQTSFIMEYMTRGIRMAKKQRTDIDPMDPRCIPVGHNYELVGGNLSHLRFIKWDYLENTYICYEFFREWDSINETYRLMKKRGVAVPVPLTSSKLEVTALRFNIIGDLINDPGHQYQPKVTIILEIKGEEYADGRRPKVHLQTTVSQRDIDFPL